MRIVKKILLWLILGVIVLLVSLWIIINSSWGQNFLVSKVTTKLSRDLKTTISIKHVDFALFNNMLLQGVLIKDRKQDTLLVANTVRVRVTDWFFFKDEVELKYIGLENAMIKLQRPDSVWNYQFLLDYFYTPSSGSKSSKTSPNISLKEIDLNKVAFVKTDPWAGQDMKFIIGQLHLTPKLIDDKNKKIDAGSFTIDAPVIYIRDYKGLRPIAPSVKKDAIQDTGITHINPAGWYVTAQNINIKDGLFIKIQEPSTIEKGLFNARNMQFSKINATLNDLLVRGDTITGDLRLKTEERSGLNIKKLNAQVKVTNQEMTFANLALETNRSSLGNFFQMRFADFDKFSNFLEEVNLGAHLQGSVLNSDDIAFFTPDARTWKKTIKLSGLIDGPVANLVGRNLDIQAGNNTRFMGHVKMNGLPDINQTFIDLESQNFHTVYNDIVSFAPGVKNIKGVNMKSVSFIDYTGHFTGFIRDFVANGTLNTALGRVVTDINMKLPVNGDPIYSGLVKTDGFDIGTLLNRPDLGVVAINGNIKGKGFDPDGMNTYFAGSIPSVSYNGYQFKNIDVKGTWASKKFDGAATINDPNAQLVLDGLIDMAGSVPRFKLMADVKKFNLKNVRLLKDNIALSGKFNLDFTGKNIDDFLGTAQLNDALITKDSLKVPIAYLTLRSEYIDGKKTLSINSDELTGNITGNFYIAELPNVFTNLLNRFYPSYFAISKSSVRNQNFSFDILTRNIDHYINLVDTSIKGFNSSHIYGDINYLAHEITVHGEIPQFAYNQYQFNNTEVLAKGNEQNLVLTGTTSNIFITDSLNIPQANFTVDASNDISHILVKTGANQTVKKADVNATVTTFSDGLKVLFQPSAFSFNDKTWVVEQNGQLELRKNKPVNGNLVLRESNQEVAIKSVPSSRGSWNDFDVSIRNLNLGDLSPFFLPQNRLEGLLSGNVLVEDPTGTIRVSSNEMNTEDLRLDADSIGRLRFSFAYDNTGRVFITSGKILNEQENISFSAGLNFKNGDANKISIVAKKYPIKILERFMGTLFSNMEGTVTGEFSHNGPLNRLAITGKGRLENAGLKVKFTQCFYKVVDTDLELKKDAIDLNGIVLIDTVSKNPVYLSGKIEHEHFDNMFFDLLVSTRKPKTTGAENNRPVLVLNTTRKDNNSFYGYVKATGSFSMNGFTNDLQMDISGIASTTEESNITLPNGSSKASGLADFMIEKKYGREMVEAEGQKASKITYDVTLTANPKVKVQVLMDELTGDKIEGRGSGTLKIHAGSSEKMTMTGRFDIEEGNYLFTFQSYLKKPFTIRKGGDNYIIWDGEPTAASINFEAYYAAEKVSYSSLVSDLSVNRNLSSLREDVYVVINLTGQLFKPIIKLSLDFPQNSVAKNDFSIAANFDQMQKNENEMLQQALYLIAFNSFAPSNAVAASSISNTITEAGLNAISSSISSLFFKRINENLNNELSKIFNTDGLSLNFGGSAYNRSAFGNTGNNWVQTDLYSNLQYKLFKGRIIIRFNSTFQVPLQGTSISQTVNFLPDFTIDFLINKSGSITATFFYRQNEDYLTTQATGAAKSSKKGGSFSYRKEFNSLRDIFIKRKKQAISLPLITDSIGSNNGIRN